jgi:sulfate/thiosulfate transport system permease protein
VVLISGNIPFETQVSSVFIYTQVESNNLAAASAISVVLLLVALVVLLAISLFSRWAAKHEL